MPARFLLKTILAITLLAALAGWAGTQLAPHLALSTVLLYSAIGAVALFALLVVSMVVSLSFRQFILRKGGTDTDWFWFSGEPPGLQQLRRQIKK